MADVPTIGIGKNLHMIDGLERDAVDAEAARSLQRGGQSFPLVGDSGTTWGACMRSTDSARNPIFVSIGHRISLPSAVRLAHLCCQHRIPEPVRLADLRSREFIRKWKSAQAEAAGGGNADAAVPAASPLPALSVSVAPSSAVSSSSSSAVPSASPSSSPLSSSRSPAEHKQDAESECPPALPDADSGQQIRRQSSAQGAGAADASAAAPSPSGGSARTRQTFVPAERAAACVLN